MWRRTGIAESTACMHSDFFINFIKGRYVIFWSNCVYCEIIIESINSDSFQDFPDADKIVVVAPPNPIAKQFPTIINCHPHSNNSIQPQPTTLSHPELRSDWRDFLYESTSLTEPKKLYMKMGRAIWRIETL